MIGRDKTYHILAGIVASITIGLLWIYLDLPGDLLIISWGLSWILGIAKELWDEYYRKTKFSANDVGATILGGWFGTMYFANPYITGVAFLITLIYAIWYNKINKIWTKYIAPKFIRKSKTSK